MSSQARGEAHGACEADHCHCRKPQQARLHVLGHELTPLPTRYSPAALGHVVGKARLIMANKGRKFGLGVQRWIVVTKPPRIIVWLTEADCPREMAGLGPNEPQIAYLGSSVESSLGAASRRGAGGKAMHSTVLTAQERDAVAEAMRCALELHKRGILDQAEGLDAGVLRLAPDHVEALHFLGVLKNQQGAGADCRRARTQFRLGGRGAMTPRLHRPSGRSPSIRRSPMRCFSAAMP
jgi:hypothetical protein